MKSIEKEAYDALPWYKKVFHKVIHHFTSVEDAYSCRPKKWIYNLVLSIARILTGQNLAR